MSEAYAVGIGSLSATLVGEHYPSPPAFSLGAFNLNRMKKIAVMLDGGHVRVYTKKAGYKYEPDYIEKIAHACVLPNEETYRVLYYDCAPYQGNVTLPISGKRYQFQGSDKWIHDLAHKDS